MRVWMPLPDTDFDTTEVAVPWKVLREAGHEVVFATERGGEAPACDPKLIDGVLFGRLGARPAAIEAYRELERSPEFRQPVAWGEIDPERFDGLVLAGGHAPGMKQYLGSAELQAKVRDFWALERPVGAICHGVLVLARAGVLGKARTTCLTKSMEKGRVPADVVEARALLPDLPGLRAGRGRRGARRSQAVRAGPIATYSRPWVVEDGRYVSARWPGDASLFATRFEALLSAGPRPQPEAATPRRAT
jgi:putative intracellular protease/amidase